MTMLRRTPAILLATALALLGVAAVAVYVANRPTNLRIAVGPNGSENARLVANFAQLLHRQKSSIQLKVITTDGPTKSAEILQARGSDLAVVRSDIALPSDGLTVATLRRDALVILAPAASEIKRIPDLRGKTMGVVFSSGINLPSPANRRLLALLLGYYGLDVAAMKLTDLPEREAAAALKAGLVDALFMVSSPAGRDLPDLIGQIVLEMGAPPLFIPIKEADAIAERTPAMEHFDITRGVLGGAPALPPETIKTLAIAHRLVAHRALDDATVSLLTQHLLTQRPALTLEQPIAAQIEAPEADRGAASPVHPGTVDYLEGETKTFMDRYGDWFYLAVMLIGFLGSGLVGLAGLTQGYGRAQRRQDLHGLVDLLASIRQAPGLADLELLDAEADAAFAQILDRIAGRALDQSQIAAFTLALDQVRHASAERRKQLSGGRALPRPLPSAAE